LIYEGDYMRFGDVPQNKGSIIWFAGRPIEPD
jgi:hypothetical protein